jgi:SAM-dependent methyltransferase
METTKEWFEDWFNSPYYHTLYGNRDENEASMFIEALLTQLNPSPDSTFLDLACGKGRHAIKINSMGFTTWGVDLSEESILYAKQFESGKLKFKVGDMREVNFDLRFDFVFNLFTSFGYFNDRGENHRMLNAISRQLKPNGQLVIDFLNYHKIKDKFPSTEIVTRGGIDFHIEKHIHDGRIIKDIRFNDKGQNYHFSEKLQAIDSEEMLQMLEKAGFAVKTIWGDYRLLPYRKEESDRLILWVEKRENV